MARDIDARSRGSDVRSPAGDGADWAVLALAPLALAAMMLIAAAAFAEGTEDPAAAAGQTTATEEESMTDCVASGGETVEGMPATKHQEQVLKTEEQDLAAMEPAAGCPETGEMPATQHQKEVLDGDKEDAAPAQ